MVKPSLGLIDRLSDNRADELVAWLNDNRELWQSTPRLRRGASPHSSDRSTPSPHRGATMPPPNSPSRPLDLAEVSVLSVRRLTDPVVDQSGFDARSAYTERFWLPTLGPSSTLALRLLAGQFATGQGGTFRDSYQIEIDELGRALGLAGTGRNAPVRRSLRRLVQFDMARTHTGTFAVRTHVPALPAHRVKQLSPSMQRAHTVFLEQIAGSRPPHQAPVRPSAAELAQRSDARRSIARLVDERIADRPVPNLSSDATVLEFSGLQRD